ncbi:MAG TPA: class I SAM-dependent methyltransferase [Clostridiales bacterium UBA8960]|jgi:ribosomal protein L37AE/L43A|nr:class I SAM-dependent methyltransferase [Clostridiales bacterium UBA8960]
MSKSEHNVYEGERCKICGSECTQILYEKIESTYHKCTKCAFIFKDPACYVTSVEEQQIYDSHINTVDDPAYVAYFDTFIQKCIIRFIGDSKQALDFGSGPEPVLAQILRSNYGFEVDIYDKYYAPEKAYIGNSYDLITATEVVEHLKDPLPYFELFKSLLKPMGVLAVMTQFHHDDERRFEHWHYRRDESHVSFFTPQTMATIAERVGLEIVYIDAHKNVAFKLK